MSTSKRQWIGLVFCAGIAVLGAAGPAAAQSYYELLRRVPDSANALVLVNVEDLLRSPISLKEGWQQRQESKYLAGVSVPPDTKQMLQASKVDWTEGARSVWDVCLVDVDHQISIPTVARSEGGYVDKVEGFDAAWSPRNAFFVALAPQIGGLMLPANRQDLAHWLSGIKARKDPTVSKYLQEAVKEAHGKAQFVVACDMGNLLARPQVRGRLRASQALAGKPLDLDKLTTILTGIRGVIFSVEAGNALEGKLRVDFSDTTDPLKTAARDVILEVLDAQGVMLPEMRDWRTLVYGQAIRFEGRLSPASLQTLSRFIAIPSKTLPTEASPSLTAGSPSDSRAATVKATQRYFHAVSDLVDDLRAKEKSTQGYNMRLWSDRYALEIDRMPILNVDEDALAYGTYASQTLRTMRNIGVNTRANEQYARASYYDDSGYTDNALTATRIQRQAGAQSTVTLNAVWTELETRTADLRKKLTQRYQVEF